MKTPFPYIPGLLAFREAPALVRLLERVAVEHHIDEIVMVDGNGRLHPRRSGIATMLGVATNTRTIGVGKSLLCGSVDQPTVDDGTSPIIHDGEQIGSAIRTGNSVKPLFVSAGHQIGIDDAVRITQAMLFEHRLPEPIYHADRISRKAAKATS